MYHLSVTYVMPVIILIKGDEAMSINSSEKGQALIIIAFAAIVLFGFAALAIDGSMVFSDKRHAQNAADTAALDAALSKTRGGSWAQEGLDRASSNGYNDNGASNEVEVYSPPIDGDYAGNDEYVQVKITSHVNTFFARVIGFEQLTNRVEAIARASLPEATSWFDGKALVSTMEGCRSAGDPHDPFTVGGSSTTIVNNSGIFVNSSCTDGSAFTDNGGGTVTTDEGVCVVGSVPQTGITGIFPYPDGNCGSQVDLAKYQLPNPDCAQAGSITGSGGNYEAWPGYFNMTGNQSFPEGTNSGELKLHKGIYCLFEGMNFNGNLNITTDLNGNGVHDSDSEGVLFYVPDGDITFNGGSDVFVHAISSLSGNYPPQFLNYLIFVPPTNDADVTITGNNGSEFTGTVLAPASHVTLNGSGNSFSLDTQIIGYDMTITGNGNIEITFNQANNAVTTTNPGIELTQ
jgi:hypothetical protein